MSDNIPLEIQMEIIKWLPVKPLIQFRSVSKPWKSFIDSSHFIKAYGARHTQPHSHILSYKPWKSFIDLVQVNYSSDPKFICLVDDDNETFKVQQQEFVVSPLLKQFRILFVVGACHGLLCLFGVRKGSEKCMAVIWNPCIGKSFGIVVPNFGPRTQCQNVFGFGVCPVTRDPTVVRILCADKMPWHVEVFTLSSGVWNVIPSGNLPRPSMQLNKPPTQVVIDRFIYWGASEMTYANNGEFTTNHMVVSFDLITKEFRVVDLPNSLTNELVLRVCVSKLMGSLVVFGYIQVEGALCCGVWVMEHDSYFRKLFTIRVLVSNLVGFSKSGETIFEIQKMDGNCTTLNVYDPCSQQIKNLGISGLMDSFFMGSYKESLLLLDHLDSRIYYDNN